MTKTATFSPPPPPPPPTSPPAVDALSAENSLIPSFSTPSQLHLPAEPQPQENFTFTQHQRLSKRHRSYSDLCLVPQLPSSLFEQSPFVLPSVETAPSPDFGMPAPPTADGGVGLSAQSVAARQRRKRISEKTQELGRLIPGGTKMNTAEMLQSAHKYVRFLQAQVGILGLMGSLQVTKKHFRESTPKQIREVMKCPDIQLSHIKSRLQMCRIRMEEDWRSGSNSSGEPLLSRRRETMDSFFANREEQSFVVVEETEFMPFSLQWDRQRPLKRFRVEEQPIASSSLCFEEMSDAANRLFYFNYFEPAFEWRTVPNFSSYDLFRKEKLNTSKNHEQGFQAAICEQESGNDNLKLSLSLCMPGNVKNINLDLSMSCSQS
ncbi:hypothetical protein HPP92_007297 [Vanilla planifolia]|uniref:BHLH domain-containing protein n=1 Tax=Vanilla planifolia TaxID=51239 RepID=A0A835V9Y0_VANPL|nr:hypothetical protein HPP92_007297 [Vanilla planifolia]